LNEDVIESLYKSTCFDNLYMLYLYLAYVLIHGYCIMNINIKKKMKNNKR